MLRLKRIIGWMLCALPAATVAANDVERFDDWVYYHVAAEGAEPALHVVESATPVAGIEIVYSCAAALEGPRESLMLLNERFTRMPPDSHFESLFTFASDGARAYADAVLHADPTHGSLDVDRDDLQPVLRQMRTNDAFIITNEGEAVTAIAVPLVGFDRAHARARQACTGGAS